MSLAIQLDPLEARILGVLIEKEFTTPEQYPLSLNALVNGCNQKSNRDPEMSVSEHEVGQAILRLRVAQLVEFVQLSGQRVEKYRHRSAGTLHVEPLEQAVLAELLVRGSQQPNELARRVERMQPAATPDSVQAVLDGLQRKQLVVHQERRSGERYARYAQVLAPAGGGRSPGAGETGPRPDVGPDAARIAAEIAAGHAHVPTHAMPPHGAPTLSGLRAGVLSSGSSFVAPSAGGAQAAGAPLSTAVTHASAATQGATPGAMPGVAPDVAARLAALEHEVTALRERVAALAARLGDASGRP